MTMLSKNFSLSEFTLSETAERHGIPNTPDAHILDNLQRLADTLEQVRFHLEQPVHITSGYRSAELNKMVGGSTNSAHMYGLAADFICHTLDPTEICRRVAKTNIAFDQMIHEYKWVHFAIAAPGKAPRRQLLRKTNDGYLPMSF